MRTKFPLSTVNTIKQPNSQWEHDICHLFLITFSNVTYSSFHLTLHLQWLYSWEFQNNLMLDAPFKIINKNVYLYLYTCHTFRYKCFKHHVDSSVWWGHDNSRTCVLSNQQCQYGRVKGHSRWTVQYTATTDAKPLAENTNELKWKYCWSETAKSRIVLCYPPYICAWVKAWLPQRKCMCSAYDNTVLIWEQI